MGALPAAAHLLQCFLVGRAVALEQVASAKASATESKQKVAIIFASAPWTHDEGTMGAAVAVGYEAAAAGSAAA